MSDFKVNSHLLQNYDSYYADGDSEWRRLGAADKAKNILDLCGNYQFKSVIEIGAGEGAVLQALAQHRFAPEFSALEISSTGVAAIKSKSIIGLKLCATFDGYNIPLEDKSFDLAILTHVIEHVEYPRKLVYEAKRIANHVYVEVPCEDNMRLSLDFTLDEVGHINFYSPKTIRRLLQTCGLEVIGQSVTNPSKSVYAYQNGRKGVLNYHIKKNLLKAVPSLAPTIFTYNSSLICKE